jgi:hypothetical protein
MQSGEKCLSFKDSKLMKHHVETPTMPCIPYPQLEFYSEGQRQVHAILRTWETAWVEDPQSHIDDLYQESLFVAGLIQHWKEIDDTDGILDDIAICHREMLHVYMDLNMHRLRSHSDPNASAAAHLTRSTRVKLSTIYDRYADIYLGCVEFIVMHYQHEEELCEIFRRRSHLFNEARTMCMRHLHR